MLKLQKNSIGAVILFLLLLIFQFDARKYRRRTFPLRRYLYLIIFITELSVSFTACFSLSERRVILSESIPIGERELSDVRGWRLEEIPAI